TKSTARFAKTSIIKLMPHIKNARGPWGKARRRSDLVEQAVVVTTWEAPLAQMAVVFRSRQSAARRKVYYKGVRSGSILLRRYSRRILVVFQSPASLKAK